MKQVAVNKILYIIRHGQTDYNKMGRVQGSGIDAPLNELGYQQAEAFYEVYKSQKFDKIYISKLQRTFQSVYKFIDKGIPYESLSGLNEISWGSQEGKAFTETSAEMYRETTEKWRKGDLSANVGGGESPLEVKERQQQAIKHILSKNMEQNVLICMHGRAMRILLSWLLAHPLSDMDFFEHTNLGLYVLKTDGEQFSILQRNDISHLNGLSPEK